MILCDTGPIVALIDGNDVRHRDCAAALSGLSKPLVTTWPCLTEAMHLLGRAGGQPAQEVLWGYVADGLLVLHESDGGERTRMRALMAQYCDTPMDLADASLVAAAESLRVGRVFTLDSDFYVYRIGTGRQAGVFDVVP